jgi:hypothetical protein
MFVHERPAESLHNAVALEAARRGGSTADAFPL